MEPADLAIQLLQEIRDENRGLRADINGVRADLAGLRADVSKRFDLADQRFLAVEAALKDLAKQMVLLAGLIRTAEPR